MLAPARAALVIPAWNEPDAIGPVLSEIPPECVSAVFVVVRSADDPTAVLASAHGARVLVQHQPGYGAACWTGAEAALADGADIIAFLDGDYADPPTELGRLLRPLLDDRADLVLGCRDLSRHPDALPAHAIFGNWMVLTLVRALVGRRFGDLPSFKAIRADAFRTLNMREMTYGWTVEMLVKAHRAGLRIAELQVLYRPRLGGRSKVGGSLTGSIKAAARLLRCAVAYSTLERWSVAGGQ